MPVVLLDGGLGTCLESSPYHVRFSAETPLWSSHLLTSSPQTLLGVQQEYALEGADVLLTATYQASLEGFAATHKPASEDLGEFDKSLENVLGHIGTYDDKEAAHFMRSGVSLARKAFEARYIPGQVALSLGAYGATMRPSTEYSGIYMPREMKTSSGLATWHERRLNIFRLDAPTWKDIDFVAFETLPVLEEVRAVRQVMTRINNEGLNTKRWWVSCVFPNDDLSLPDGSTVEEIVQVILGGTGDDIRRPWGIGINCTKVARLERLILQFEDAVDRIFQEPSVWASSDQQPWPWLVVYPDGAQGLVYNTDSQIWEAIGNSDEAQDATLWSDQMAGLVQQVSDRALWPGILVGGCCKTTPQHIACLRTRLIGRGLYNA